MSEKKKISAKEFREFGYLQELNRLFLHPLGLALSVCIDNETGEASFDGVWDSRDDPAGIIYDIANSEKERKDTFRKKQENIKDEMKNRKEVRIKEVGFMIEEIPGE